MESTPGCSFVPAMFRVATADVPEATSGTLARFVPPDENVTKPAGGAMPLDGLTVAVRTAIALVAMSEFTTETDVVVDTTGCVTVTVAAAVELAKFPVA
jgi:hypothetical protein